MLRSMTLVIKIFLGRGIANSRRATNIFNAFFLFSFLTPMLFALLSDIYIGRHKLLMIGLA